MLVVTTQLKQLRKESQKKKIVSLNLIIYDQCSFLYHYRGAKKSYGCFSGSGITEEQVFPSPLVI